MFGKLKARYKLEKLDTIFKRSLFLPFLINNIGNKSLIKIKFPSAFESGLNSDE